MGNKCLVITAVGYIRDKAVMADTYVETNEEEEEEEKIRRRVVENMINKNHNIERIITYELRGSEFVKEGEYKV